MDRKFKITDAKGGAAFTVRVVTRSASTQLVGLQEDGTLKIRLMAGAAGDSAANDELVSFLADELGVPADHIEIVAGANGRDKLVSVEGITTQLVETRLGKVADEAEEDSQ
jgi:uncharacterized protein YggU (UPF0235/DUF167 family)